MPTLQTESLSLAIRALDIAHVEFELANFRSAFCGAISRVEIFDDPLEGGGFLGVKDGDTFIINDNVGSGSGVGAPATATASDAAPSGYEVVFQPIHQVGLVAMGLWLIDFADLEGLARARDPGDFRQVLEKVALYKLDDPEPLTPDEVALCAPASIEAELDDILNVVAEGRSAEIGPLVQRLEGQGVNPVTLLIMAMRHFRVLYALASAQGGTATAMASTSS